MRPRDLVELVRAPAALSVPGDAVAGAAAAGSLSGRTAGIAAASVCLYWAGMAANDWADRSVDAVERPHRPIPSGRITPRQALTVACGLTAAGLAVAAVAGGRKTLLTATALAGAIWAYDTRLKHPAAMAACRGLDVLMGAGTGSMRRAAGPAAVVAAHTYAVTALSRGEVTGADRALPAATLAATSVVAASAARGAVASVLAAWYALAFGRAQKRALDKPEAGNIRAAVGAGITSLPALQGALAARHGHPATGVAVAAVAPLARKLAKAVSPT